MIDLRKVPFTYPWILKTAIGDAKTMLDIGCGTGELITFLRKDQKWNVTGVDIYAPSIKKALKSGGYRRVYKADITKLPKTITQKKYDVVFSSQVIEHLPKKKALTLLRTMEKMATKRVVIGTTVGFMHFCPLEEVHDHVHDDNPYQKHKSSWSVKEFENMGYQVNGQGFFLIYKEGYLMHSLPKICHPFLATISLLLSPIVYLLPNIGTYQINYKTLKHD